MLSDCILHTRLSIVLKQAVMKLILTFSLALLFFLTAEAQPKKAPEALYVCFDLSVNPGETSDYTGAIGNTVEGFRALQQQYGLTLQKGIPLSEAQLLRLEQQAIQTSGNGKAVAQLRNIFKVTTNETSGAALPTIAAAMRKLPGVIYCNLLSLSAIKPPIDIAPVTANFDRRQTYLDSNPGVNMRYAWSLGLTGQGINIKDVEYGFNKDHEELHDINTAYAPGMTLDTVVPVDYPEHGTAVFGIVYAQQPGGYGITGMAYGAKEMVLYPEYTMEFGYDRVRAITEAIGSSAAGDIILYELQSYGFDGVPGDERYAPAEYEQVVWSLTRAASDAGIVIVAAAGNGSQNLDDPDYAPYMAMGNSGAIIVGAGQPSRSHNRAEFSTYGSRVDVQGWGSNVFTSGYGDVLRVGNDFNQNYTNFSGTSSATPIVASCAAVLQSYYYNRTGQYLTSDQLKNIFKKTGIPQGVGLQGNIGPLPDMKAAIQFINTTLGISKTPDAPELAVYPNPFQNEVKLEVEKSVGSSQLTLFNSIGQQVYQDSFEQNIMIPTAQWQAGTYFGRVTNARGTATLRLVKQ